MIVIDANELRAIPNANDRRWLLLRELARESGNVIAVPDFTFEEFRAGLMSDIKDAWHKSVEANRKLSKYSESAKTRPHVENPERPSETANRLTSAFQSDITVLSTDASMHTEGISREIWRKLPASTSWTKSGYGARDVILWLAAKDACRTNPGKLYFVSNDAAAFGDKELHPELRMELTEDLGDRINDFIYCRNVGTLLELIAEKTEQEVGYLSVDLLGTNDILTSAVGHACKNTVSRMQSNLVGDLTAGLRMYRMETSKSLELLSIDKVSTYRIGGRAWLVVAMTWNLTAAVQQVSALTFDESEDPGLLEWPMETKQKLHVTAMVGVQDGNPPEILTVDLLSVTLPSGQ
ncbi:PIN domain-containing protein [Umezawaea beigongshangensis]|uniref:PIN domain-containing protein n=1 Tax=Umezawaea beigongshangensis TaxID=2780383 RepID=UPI0018F16D81|nr:PIN domain-containing protein [Umezawaea beigongshangensis]